MNSALEVFEGAGERVMLEVWEAGRVVQVANDAGLELLVLGGGFDDGVDALGNWSWLRLPAGIPLTAKVGPNGARVWYKAAPLLHAEVLPLEQAVAAESGL